MYVRLNHLKKIIMYSYTQTITNDTRMIQVHGFEYFNDSTVFVKYPLDASCLPLKYTDPPGLVCFAIEVICYECTNLDLTR